MMKVRGTPHHAGVYVTGSYDDFDALYNALHTVVGTDYEFDMECSRLRVLGLCYDLRHAMMGDAEMEWTRSGWSREQMGWSGQIGPEQNLHWTFPVLWPEVLYITLVLNRFIAVYAKTLAPRSTDLLSDPKVFWDPSIVQVRLFQSMIVHEVAQSVPDNAVTRTLNLFHKGAYLELAQYVDRLNVDFLECDPSERLARLPLYVKRLVQPPKEYQKLLDNVVQFTIENQCLIEDVSIGRDYPDVIDW